MSWQELKTLGKDFADSITFARTWRERDGVGQGILEVDRKEDADRLVRSLDGKRVEGCRDRLVVSIDRDEEIPRRR
jgi:hypothetical protein